MFRRMKLSHRVAALAVAALLLPGLRAFAQTSSSSSGDEFEQDDSKPQPKSDKSEETSAQPEAPPEPAAVTSRAAAAARSAGTRRLTTRTSPLLRPRPRWASRSRTPASTSACSRSRKSRWRAGRTPSLTSKNIFLRRIRFMVGGTLYKYFEFFFDTDYPNLFKSDAGDTMAGTVQERPGTEHPGRVHHVQAPRRNWSSSMPDSCCRRAPTTGSRARRSSTARTTSSTPSAATCSSDTDPLVASAGQNPIGRDLGIQLRALVRGGHIEPAPASSRDSATTRCQGPPAEVGELQHLPLRGARAGERPRRRARVLLPGDLSRHEEDPVVRRLLRLSEDFDRTGHVQVLRRRRHPRSPARARDRHRAGGLRAVERRAASR